MESNANDVLSLTLNARQERVKAINRDMQIKIAMAQQKKEDLQLQYRDRIQADTRDRLLRKIMVISF